MLIAYLCISKSSSMTDSMTFGPDWLRALSEGSTGGSGTKYHLADYRYGREEMLALFEKGLPAPISLSSFNPLYSEQVLPPLALLPQPEDERSWSGRTAQPGNSVRGRGTASLDRGGRGGGRGSRGSFQNYNRGNYDSNGSWIGTENTNEWSPRKEYTRATSVDNWRRHRNGDEDEGWRGGNHTRIPPEKWGRSTSWRGDGDGNEERSNRPNRPEVTRAPLLRQLEAEEMPEWAMENSVALRGSFDSSGAFHGCSDDEQREHKSTKKDIPLQKSISQQNITIKSQSHTLPSSQSAVSLSKSPDDKILNDAEQQETMKTDSNLIEQKQKTPPKIEQTIKPSKPIEYEDDPPKIQSTPQKEPNECKQHFQTSRIFKNSENNIDVNGLHSPDSNNRVDEEFERSQEDFVKKLVVDEELPKKPLDSFMLPTVVPPPNITPPTQDSWCYQDPQGDLQGPFPSSEMAEWFRAGYFTSTLLVKRHCDETYHRLGDLVTKCGGNPFQSNIRIAPLKQEIVPSDELLKYQLFQRQLLRQQAESMRVLSQNDTPWVMPQQRDLLSQQVLTHPQMPSDMQFFQQPQQPSQPQPVVNPIFNMINQIQQANKLPSQILGKKPAQLDPIQALVQQMGALQMQSTGTNSSGLPTNIPTSLHNSGLLNNFSNLSTSLNTGNVPVGFTGLNSTGLHNSGLHNTNSILSSNDTINSNGLSVGLTPGLHDGSRLPPRPNPLGAVDSITSTNENDPLKNLLQQLHSKQTQQIDSLWQQSQFTPTQSNMQWQPNEVPISMWDLQPPPITTSLINTASLEKLPLSQTPQQSQQTNQIKNQEKEHQRQLNENLEKERRQKELEEKQAKKEAEEKRKEEQRRQELEKKAAEEKRKKEDERVRKELEKAKKDAEEKRLRELEEKRRLKEQRKAEEEAKRKMEEQKKLEEAERTKNELKEKEEQLRMKQMEAALQRQQQQDIDLSLKTAQRIAPWSQANLTPELSLAEIQRSEREKRAEQVALQQQKTLLIQQELNAMEKQSNQINWSKKPVDNKSIKSLVEIQQEEQERLAKQTLELRAALKEKEISAPTSVAASITPWSGHGLSWAAANQWNNNIGGFWDDTTILSNNKPSALSKSSSATVVKHVVKQNKQKLKKEEQQVLKLFSNGPITDEFTEWCIATLTRLNSTVDIPTFINFLRDIESALEVKDYCKEYFGDVPATQHFVTQFLEKRRMFKPKVVTQTDDMSSPAPALTPSMQHNLEFQELKGKGKKCKKSKMIKVDARNLGFSVTAAPDRINVGDRDYVEN